MTNHPNRSKRKQRDLFETNEQQAERIARAHGWIRGNTKRFAALGEGSTGLSAATVVPFYFYNVPADILDTEHKSWADLCASQPILASLLRDAKWETE